MGQVTAINECPVPPEPASFTWSFPGAPIKVHLELDVVRRMQAHLRGAADARRGLLLGRIDGQSTIVSGFQPLATGGGTEIGKAIAAFEGAHGEQSLVGYYRTHQEDVLRLDDADLSLAGTFFQNPHHVFLLIQAIESEPANASFFFWDGGRMNGEFPFLEFPFDSALLAAVERRRIEATELRAVSVREETAAAAQPIPEERGGRRLLVGLAWISLAVFLAVAAVTAGVRFFPQGFSRLFDRVPEASVSSQPSAHLATSAEQPSIGFEATRQNGDLRLTWKRENAFVRSATAGTLSIQDGNSRREIQLLAEQLHVGSILYSPLSDQVQVQLTVFTPGATATESVIVITPRVESPKAKTAASNTANAGTVRPAPSSGGAYRTTPFRAFTPSAAASPASGPRVVLDAPPALTANPNAAVAGSASPLERELPSVPPPPVQAVESPVRRPAPEAATYYPPVAIHTALPGVPTSLQVLTWTPKTLGITVSIDDRGRVVKTSAVPGSGLHQLLIDAALEAARQWRFRPARKGDTPVPSEMILHFDFKPSK
jgi:protein TonB